MKLWHVGAACTVLFVLGCIAAALLGIRDGVPDSLACLACLFGIGAGAAWFIEEIL
jgi:hypothetical protein